MTLSRFLSGCSHCGCALFHFLQRYIFFAGCNMPDMPKGIFQGAAPVRHRPQQFRAGGHGLVRNLVHIPHIEMNVDSFAYQTLTIHERWSLERSTPLQIKPHCTQVKNQAHHH